MIITQILVGVGHHKELTQIKGMDLMTKAKAKSRTLDIRSEAMKGDLPKTEIQKMAAEIGRCFQIMDEAEKIEWAARDKEKEIPAGQHYASFALTSECAGEVRKRACRRQSFLETAILNSEATDALDALIQIMLFSSNVESGKHWVEETIEAQTKEEKEVLIEMFDDEVKTNRLVLESATRGLCRDLGVSPVELGLKAYDGNIRTFELTAAMRAVRDRAKEVGV